MNDPVPGPPAPSAKKGIPALGWLGIGCGTLIIIAIVVISLLVGWCKRTVGDIADFKNNPEKAAAEMVVKFNPDLKKISQDDSKGEMTIRTKDGQEITLSYKDISEGKFTIKDEKGNVTQIGKSDLSNVPVWVPRVPGMKTASGAVHTVQDGKSSGLYNATSGETIESLEKFFKQEAERLKLSESSRTSFNTDGIENRILAYEGNGQKLNVVINGRPGEDALVNVGYEELVSE